VLPVSVPAATVTAQFPPRAQLCPFTVVAALASAELGIEVTATDSEGVLVPLATVGTIHEGQFTDGAPKLFTVPGAKPQSISVPLLSAKHAPSFATVLVGPVISAVPEPAGAPPSISVSGVPPPHNAR
jgi:hypothetical protein